MYQRPFCSSGTPQGLGPVAGAMFRTMDLRYLADAARADHVFGQGGGNQGALTFFAAVTRNRPEVLEHLLDSHRQTALVVVDAYARVSLASNHVFSGHHSR